ncbi:MAG TPA: glycosyltransferase [Alphaproteobacteria bacterium]|jgi:glycosyltransferase involved in cell wall biosynthesis
MLWLPPAGDSARLMCKKSTGIALKAVGAAHREVNWPMHMQSASSLTHSPEAAPAWLKRVALLNRYGHWWDQQERVSRLRIAFARTGIECEWFDRSDAIDAFQPDCVLVTSHQDSKLTKFPTYGLVAAPMHHFLGVPRFVRNLLTYDGYLTLSPVTKQILGDLTFSARKLDTKTAFFGITFPMTVLDQPDLGSPALCYVASDSTHPVFDELLTRLARSRALRLYGRKGRWRGRLAQAYAGTLASDGEAIAGGYRQAGVGLCLNACDDLNKLISPRLFEIVASGAVAIANRSNHLVETFGNSLLYIDPYADVGETQTTILEHLAWIKAHPEEAQRKIIRAHRVFVERFALERLIPNLIALHQETLVAKGYVPAPNEEPQTLPSVSYIVRTGGRSRPYLARALDSLVAQDYPNLQVILVLHKRFEWLKDIVDRYSAALKVKVVEAQGSLRSTAIVRGMQSVDTDLFGLLDDDDELLPNHVRTLVKTLRYHNGRDWRGRILLAYASSFIVSDDKVFPERQQWRDSLIEERGERRVLEHYRFYNAEEMANHFWYVMSNAWLAHRDIIDDEVLADPETDTCEDLYFELQFAQRTHFAFSGETTAIHHYHSNGNSTFVDAHRHEYDTLRHGLRTHMRTFPRMTQYYSHLTSRMQASEPPYHISPFTPPNPKPLGYCSVEPEVVSDSRSPLLSGTRIPNPFSLLRSLFARSRIK